MEFCDFRRITYIKRTRLRPWPMIYERRTPWLKKKRSYPISRIANAACLQMQWRPARTASSILGWLKKLTRPSGYRCRFKFRSWCSSRLDHLEAQPPGGWAFCIKKIYTNLTVSSLDFYYEKKFHSYNGINLAGVCFCVGYFLPEYLTNAWSSMKHPQRRLRKWIFSTTWRQV